MPNPPQSPGSFRPRGLPPLLPWQPCLVAYAAGILGVAHFLPACCALGLLALFPRPAPGSTRPVALILAFGLGLAAGSWAMPAPPKNPPPCVEGTSPVTARGTVAEVDPRPEGRLAVVLDAVRLSGQGCPDAPLGSRLAVTIDHPAFTPLPGDVLAVTGRMRSTAGFANPGTTDFAFLRRLDGIFFRTYARGDRNQVARLESGRNPPARWRLALQAQVAKALTLPPVPTQETRPDGSTAAPGAEADAAPMPASAATPGRPPAASPAALAGRPEPDAAARAGRAMIPALLFDDKSGFTEADLDLVRRASLAHTLALSGMNVGYVAAMAVALTMLAGTFFPGIYLRLARPRLVVLVAAPLVAAYCWLGGASPSLVRAALMFAAFGLMLLLGRDKALFDGLFLALAAFLLVSPLSAFSASLQLSVLAVAGIAALWPLYSRWADRLPGPGPVRTGLAWSLGILWTSVTAEAAVLPLLTRLFGDLPFNPWINLLWLPVLGAVVMPLLLTGAALVAVPGLETAGSLLLTLAADCCAWLMRLLAGLDAGGLLVSRPVLRPWWPEMLGCYGLLAVLAMVVAGRSRPLAATAASLVLLIAPTAWRLVEDARPTVSLTVLDVGQGQSAAVTLPGGRRLLIDAGGLFGSFDVGRAVVGPSLTDGRPPRIDRAMASHPHSDHVKGFLWLLGGFDIGAWHDNGASPEGALGPALDAALARRGIPRQSLADGDSIDLGHGLALAVLHPGPGDDRTGNNGSLILRLTQNGHGLALFPGDAETGVLRRLAAAGRDLRAEVLLLPHHGSSSSLTQRFYAAVAPKIAIASAGDSGHYPSAKVVEALKRLSCPTLATNRHGAVTVRFDATGRISDVDARRQPNDPAVLPDGLSGLLSATPGKHH
ncbi:ComEC/Rec2 family competence protein [Solidesulfovibrio sp.]